MSLAVVLSGGGARGAYEVGVLSAVLGARKTRAPKIDFVCGTSVGAVNGAFVASTAGDSSGGLSRLEALWGALELDQVLEFGLGQMAGLHRVLLGGRKPRGLFDAAPLSALVENNVDWGALRANIDGGVLQALTITATHVATGRPVVFLDGGPGARPLTTLPKSVAVCPTGIGPAHVLASAAIPLVFPPVPVDGDLHCDGGLRLNTPMAPAVHLGAERLLVVTVSTPPGTAQPGLGAGRAPGAPFLLGKVMNAFLLDHLNHDLEELERINAILSDGTAAFGPTFVDRMNDAAALRGALPRRLVRVLAIRPSLDIGELSAQHLRKHRARFGRVLGRAFLRLLDVGEGASADLASYLLFDGDLCRRLIELGRVDAERRRDEIDEFLWGSADRQ